MTRALHTAIRKPRALMLRARRDAVRDMLRAGVVEQRRRKGVGPVAILRVARDLEAGRAV